MLARHFARLRLRYFRFFRLMSRCQDNTAQSGQARSEKGYMDVDKHQFRAFTYREASHHVTTNIPFELSGIGESKFVRQERAQRDERATLRGSVHRGRGGGVVLIEINTNAQYGLVMLTSYFKVLVFARACTCACVAHVCVYTRGDLRLPFS